MRTLIIIFVMIFLSSFNSCKKEQIVSQNNDEKILTIKHTIIRDGPGYIMTELTLNTTSVKYYAPGSAYLPVIDTTFIINENKWNEIKKSFVLTDYFSMDSVYENWIVVDSPQINLEVITNERRKIISYWESSVYPKEIDSLNKLLFQIREELL